MSQNAEDIRRAHAPALAAYFGVETQMLSDAQVLLWASRQQSLRLEPAPQLHIDRDRPNTFKLRE